MGAAVLERGTADRKRLAAELARGDFSGPKTRREEFPTSPLWAQFTSLGSLLWLDTGDLEEARKLWTRDFTNLTTNNTLANKEVQKGLFDDVIREAGRALREADPAISERELVWEVGFIVNCRLGLRLVEALDASVSVELHPAMADDAELSLAYGRRYYAVCPERFVVKVPLTADGLIAARRLSDDGIPVNFTLGFSARQNYLAACLSRTAFVNVFMGRLNSFVADHKLGDGKNVGERATMATQVALRELRERRELTQPRLIGASLRSAGQLVDLAGLDVFTMPTAAAGELVKRNEESPVTVTDQVGRDFPVTLNEGVDERAVGLDRLWDVPVEFRRWAESFLDDAPPRDGAALRRSAREAGFSDLMRDWTTEETAAIKADGKIPDYGRWKDGLAAGEVGLDDLMSISALQSFVTDQEQLDARIAGFLRDA